MDQQDLMNAVRSGDATITSEGILIPGGLIRAKGTFCYSKRGEPEEFSENLVVGEGLTYMLAAALGGATATTTWYVAIFGGNVTPVSTWDGANFPSMATELTAYTAAARIAWTPTAAADGVISSFTAKSSFEANAEIIARGAALLSGSAKNDVSGVLFAASRFGTDKSLSSGEILDVGYQVELTAA
jgi:hypothetical protein